MGMDPTVGITGWSRGSRNPEDKKTDNGAIVIYDIGGDPRPIWTEDENGGRIADIDPQTKRQRIHYRDLQVAEFAAPCDAVEIARVADILGRWYLNPDGDPCELIWEGYPGCGMLTTQELLRLGYPNLWHWEYIGGYAEQTSNLGWRSFFQSLSILWTRARRHLMQENVTIRSKWLREEYANAQVNARTMRASGSYGNHDDRFMASNLALWAAHRWTYEMAEDRQNVSENPAPLDFQRSAPVLGEEYTTYSEFKEGVTDSWWE